MTNLPCECLELKPKGETNSSFLVLHPLSGVHTVKTVGSHLNVGNSFPLIADREINQTFESLHSSFNVVAFNSLTTH